MKKSIFIIVLSILALGLFAQTNIVKTVTLSNNPLDNNYTYYSFPLSATSDYLAGTKDSALFTVYTNKSVPVEVSWYVALDTANMGSNSDSCNMNIKENYKKFDEQSFTTLKTIAWDGDATGDYAAEVSDSTYLVFPPLAATSTRNISLTKPEFSRIFQLSITPTSGAGIGTYRDKFRISKVIVSVKLR
jgi:hypothetical protein